MAGELQHEAAKSAAIADAMMYLIIVFCWLCSLLFLLSFSFLERNHEESGAESIQRRMDCK